MTFPGKLLPDIGLEMPLRIYATHVPLRMDGQGVLSLDFEGNWRVRSEKNLSAGLGGVQLRVLGMESTARSDVLGTVTLNQADTDATPLSLLEVIGNLPPTFRSTMFLDLMVTIENPPNAAGPLTLAGTKTATLVNNNLTVFPPQSAMYQLQEPVDLAPVGAPDQVMAQLQQFPVTVTHIP